MNQEQFNELEKFSRDMEDELIEYLYSHFTKDKDETSDDGLRYRIWAVNIIKKQCELKHYMAECSDNEEYKKFVAESWDTSYEGCINGLNSLYEVFKKRGLKPKYSTGLEEIKLEENNEEFQEFLMRLKNIVKDQ